MENLLSIAVKRMRELTRDIVEDRVTTDVDYSRAWEELNQLSEESRLIKKTADCLIRALSPHETMRERIAAAEKELDNKELEAFKKAELDRFTATVATYEVEFTKEENDALNAADGYGSR
jgi:hypothetical protein